MTRPKKYKDKYIPVTFQTFDQSDEETSLGSDPGDFFPLTIVINVMRTQNLINKKIVTKTNTMTKTKQRQSKKKDKFI